MSYAYLTGRRLVGDRSEVSRSPGRDSHASSSASGHAAEGRRANGETIAKGALGTAAGLAGMVASGAAMATGVGLVPGSIGMITSASAAAMGVSTMAAGLAGMTSDDLNDVSELANPFGAASAAAAMALGASNSDAILVGKTGALLSQAPGAFSYSAYSNWSKTQLALQQYGLSKNATTAIQVAGELGLVYDKASFVSDTFRLGTDISGYLSSGDRSIHDEMGFRSGDLGVGDFGGNYGGFGGFDGGGGGYAGEGALLGGKDLNSEFGFDGADHGDSGGDFDGGDFGGDLSDGYDGSGFDGDGGYGDYA